MSKLLEVHGPNNMWSFTMPADKAEYIFNGFRNGNGFIIIDTRLKFGSKDEFETTYYAFTAALVVAVIIKDA